MARVTRSAAASATRTLRSTIGSPQSSPPTTIVTGSTTRQRRTRTRSISTEIKTESPTLRTRTRGHASSSTLPPIEPKIATSSNINDTKDDKWDSEVVIELDCGTNKRGSRVFEPFPGWYDAYTAIAALRAAGIPSAPVDEMEPQLPDGVRGTQFIVLLALVVSSQTRDIATVAVARAAKAARVTPFSVVAMRYPREHDAELLAHIPRGARIPTLYDDHDTVAIQLLPQILYAQQKARFLRRIARLLVIREVLLIARAVTALCRRIGLSPNEARTALAIDQLSTIADVLLIGGGTSRAAGSTSMVSNLAHAATNDHNINNNDDNVVLKDEEIDNEMRNEDTALAAVDAALRAAQQHISPRNIDHHPLGKHHHADLDDDAVAAAAAHLGLSDHSVDDKGTTSSITDSRTATDSLLRIAQLLPKLAAAQSSALAKIAAAGGDVLILATSTTKEVSWPKETGSTSRDKPQNLLLNLCNDGVHVVAALDVNALANMHSETVTRLCKAATTILESRVDDGVCDEDDNDVVLDDIADCTDLTRATIPTTLETVQQLPGVGPKIGLLYVASLGHHAGIAVDRHVHRISQRLGVAPKRVAPGGGPSQPEDTRRVLERIVPARDWPTFNPVLVGWGQAGPCRAVPACDECPVRSLCPTGGGAAVRHGWTPTW